MTEENKKQIEEEKEKSEEIQKSDNYIRLRVNPFLKKSLQKITKEKYEYKTLSDLIRDILNDYIGGKLISISSIKLGETKEISENVILKAIKEAIKQAEEKIMKSNEETKKSMGLFIQHVENGLQTFPTDVSDREFRFNIESEIIKIVSVKPMTSEQLSIIFEIPEHRLLRFLNPMLKRKTVGLNKQMEYDLVEKYNVNELQFKVDE